MSQIAAMLDAHYAGEINIVNYWSVGDTRIELLEEIPAGTTGETQPVQYVSMIIIGFNHDDLETTVNVRSKAAITIMTTMGEKGYMDPKPSSPYASMSEVLPYARWSACARRSWCNNDFYNVLPSVTKGLIKPVIKESGFALNSFDNRESTVDFVFLLSTNEYSGEGYNGNRYEFFVKNTTYITDNFKSSESNLIFSRVCYYQGDTKTSLYPTYYNIQGYLSYDEDIKNYSWRDGLIILAFCL